VHSAAETAILGCPHLLQGKSHFLLDDDGDIQLSYFGFGLRLNVQQKAILESDEEWSQNAKLIDTRGGKPIGRAVPKGFPYFHVEFGLDGGFAHTIEDVEQFPANFGKV
jgi:hypothetical protein